MSWLVDYLCSWCRNDDAIASQPIKKPRRHVEEAINVKAKKILGRDPEVHDFTDAEKREIEAIMGALDDLPPAHEIAGPTRMYTAAIPNLWKGKVK